MEIYFDAAGLVCIGVGRINLHLLVRKEFRQWLWREDWWDGPIYSFGSGPLFLVVYHEV